MSCTTEPEDLIIPVLWKIFWDNTLKLLLFTCNLSTTNKNASEWHCFLHEHPLIFSSEIKVCWRSLTFQMKSMRHDNTKWYVMKWMRTSLLHTMQGWNKEESLSFTEFKMSHELERCKVSYKDQNIQQWLKILSTTLMLLAQFHNSSERDKESYKNSSSPISFRKNNSWS